MSKANPLFKRITSLFLSLVFVLTTFAAVDFSKSAAIEAKAEENERFLMAYFTGNLQTEQQIRFAVSTDGKDFKPLYGGNAVLQEKSTDTHNFDGYTNTDGVRDPYIFKGGDGYYYCIATDLEATAYGFWGNQSQMVLWRSLDLINWSDAYYINVAQICNAKRGTSFTNSDFQRTWAPEVFYENGQYMIYFALAGGDYQATRMHYMITDDLMDWTHYSAPQVLYDPGYDDIDADIIKEGDTYYMFYKDETPGRSTVCLATASQMTGPYTYIAQFDTSSNTGAIEGCEVYTVGNNYYLVADRFGAAGNFAIYNLGNSLEAVKNAASNQHISVTSSPVSTVEELYGFTNLTPRHGSIVHISESEYNALVAASGGVTDDDIMYNFTTAYDIDASGWRYETYNDSSLRSINVMMNGSGSSIKIPHDGGYATLKGTTFFVNDENVRAMLPDDVYTVSFDYSLESTTNLSAPIFALGTGSGAPSVNTDYVMIFGNGDMWVRKSGESSDTFVGNKALALGVTYHYDIVSDGTDITFYRDGIQIGSIQATVDFPESGTRYASFGFTDGHSSSGYGYGTYSHIRFRDTAVLQYVLKEELGNNLIYRRDDGNSTVDGMDNVLNVSNSDNKNKKDAVVSKVSSSYSFAGWINPGSEINSNVILGVGNDKWEPAPYGRYFSVLETGTIHFNYCSGSNSGGNYSEHFFDVDNIFNNSLAVNTWSYIQINIIPISNNQVNLSVWVNGDNTYQDNITLTTKVDGNNTTGNDYSYGVLGFMQLPTNYVFLGNMGVPSWWQAEGDTSYVKDIRFYAQALDPEILYAEAIENRDAAKAREYVRANLESYDVTSNDNRFTEVAYHQGVVATNAYSNVIYDPIWTTHWDTVNRNNAKNDGYAEITTDGNKGIALKMAMPENIVLVNDGVNDVALPAVAEVKRISNVNTRKFQTLYADHTNKSSNPDPFEFRDYWKGRIDNNGREGWNLWPADVNNTSYVGYAPYQDKEDDFGNNDQNPRYYSNKLYYTGSGDTSKYYEDYHNLVFWVYASSSSSGYSDTTFHNDGNNVYIINYAPVYNALKSSNPTAMPNGKDNLGIKDFYTAYVKNNEDNWTESSLKQFYYAAYLLLTSNPNDYKSSFSSGVDTNVKSAADEIKNAMNAFNSINLEKRADFTALDSKFAQGESVIANLGQTNLYGESLVSALITALNDAKANAATTADERKDISENIAQSEINTQVNNLISAINAINNASACEVSALNEVIDRLNNLDDDIYDYSGEDVQAIIEALTDGIDGSDCAYTSSDSVNYTVKTVQNGVSQPLVDSAVGVGLSSLADNVRMYDVVFTGDASLNFAYEGSEEKITDNHYKSTYNNTAVFSTDNADTAWFMEYNSETTSRDKQYQGSGETYTTKVIGNMNVTVEQRCAATPNRVSIQRDYQNGKYPVQQINYVASGSDYQLPEATKILGYEFEGYYIGGERITASSVTVNSDIEISARYSASTSNTFSVVVKSTQGETLYSSDDSYNTKVSVSDSGAYGWVEKISGENAYRPFCIGSDLNFYVTEATEIKAVESAAEFSAAGTLPAINIKQSDANVEIVSGRNKVFFNGQIVNDPSGEATILEYGFLIGTTINSTPTESELVLENAGAHEDYRIIRAKSTKLVGANQFTIAVSGLSGAISYRGYVTYQIGGADGEIKTVYTSVANQNI